MRYYIRQPTSSKVEGPFTEAELVERVMDGRIAKDAQATGDIGEPVKKLTQWVYLWHIPVLRKLFSEVEPPKVKPEPPRVRDLVFGVLGTLLFTYSALTRHAFSTDWAWAAFCAFIAIYTGSQLYAKWFSDTSDEDERQD